jgi:hypothetical protein
MNARQKFQVGDRVIGAAGEHVDPSLSGRRGTIVEHRPLSGEYAVQFDDGPLAYVVTSWIDREPAASETKAEEHHRLEGRTGELQKEHEALDLNRTPFDQPDHDRHAADLARHQRDLVRHRARADD